MEGAELEDAAAEVDVLEPFCAHDAARGKPA